MSVTISSLDFKDTIFNCEEGYIEGTTTKIEDENVLLSLTLLVKTVGNSSSGGLVDDTGNIESSNGTGILGGLSLTIVEIGWDGDDSRADGFTEISLSNFLHLGKDHGGDFLGLELLLFTLEVDDNHGLLTGSRLDFEWPKSNIFLDSSV